MKEKISLITSISSLFLLGVMLLLWYGFYLTLPILWLIAIILSIVSIIFGIICCSNKKSLIGLIIGIILLLFYSIISYLYYTRYDNINIPNSNSDVPFITSKNKKKLYFAYDSNGKWHQLTDDNDKSYTKKLEYNCSTETCSVIDVSSDFAIIEDDNISVYSFKDSKTILKNIIIPESNFSYSDSYYGCFDEKCNYFTIGKYIFNLKTGTQMLSNVSYESINTHIIYDKYIEVKDANNSYIYNLETSEKLNIKGESYEMCHGDIKLNGDKCIIVYNEDKAMIYNIDLGKYTYETKADTIYSLGGYSDDGTYYKDMYKTYDYANMLEVRYDSEKTWKKLIIDYHTGKEILTDFDEIICRDTGYCILQNENRNDSIYNMETGKYLYKDKYETIYGIVGNNEYLVVEDNNQIFLVNISNNQTIMVLDNLNQAMEEIKEITEVDESRYVVIVTKKENKNYLLKIEFKRNSCNADYVVGMSDSKCYYYEYDFKTNKIGSKTYEQCYCGGY